MSRHYQELRPNRHGPTPCTPLPPLPPEIDRLLDVMVRWWQGRSLADSARRHGISRTRVRMILGQVGCTSGLRMAGLLRRPGAQRPIPVTQVAAARNLLRQPPVRSWTMRQRAVVAWLALGLTSPQIAQRMNLSPQRIRQLAVAARGRWEGRRCGKTRRTLSESASAHAAVAQGPDQIMELSWEGWDEMINSSAGV